MCDKGEIEMKDKLFGSLKEITASCLDKDGNYIAIPVLDGVHFINDEMYAYITKFCDASGNEVDTITASLIAKKIQSQIH